MSGGCERDRRQAVARLNAIAEEAADIRALAELSEHKVTGEALTRLIHLLTEVLTELQPRTAPELPAEYDWWQGQP